MEFRFRAGERRPLPSSSDSTPARFSNPCGGGFGANGKRAEPSRGGPPPVEWEAVAWRERIIRQEVERRLIEQEVRREFERDLALASCHHGGFAPDSFFAPACFMPPPPPAAMPMRPQPQASPPMPMPMHPHPHVPPPRPFEDYGEWLGFGRFGPRRHAGLLTADEKRWSPPPPKQKHKLELREIGPCKTSKVLSCEPKVSGMKRKSDAIAAATEPRKVQKPAQDWTCALCQVTATSEACLNEHLEGKKHKAKLAQSGVIKVINDDKSSLEATTENKNGTASSDAPKKICINVDGAMHDVVQKNNYLWCERCRVRCDSNMTMAGHLRGKKHSELNKVWKSIMAVRMNAKTMEGVASTCKSDVNEDDFIENSVENKNEDTGMTTEVDENGPIENPVEIKKEGTNMATAGGENVLTEIPVETSKEGKNMATNVLENGPLETPTVIKTKADLTTDITQLVPGRSNGTP